MSDSNVYFANKPTKECIENLEFKIDSWADGLVSSGIVERIRKSWSYYHGSFDYEEMDVDGHGVKFTGDQGELLKMPVNHYRNIATYLLNITTSTRPAMKARSINTDYKSLSQTILADGLLDYYMREKSLEDILKKATEYAIVLSEGWVKMEWDSSSGEPYGFNEDTKTWVHEGDISYRALGPLEVIRDVMRGDAEEQDWLIVKTYKNKHDLIARYPEFKDEIQAIQTRDTEQMFTYGNYMKVTSEQIPVYEFYHKRTDSVPDGRYIQFLNSEVALVDMPLPYRFIPLFPVRPSQWLGTPFGYTIMFDLLPIQESINMLYSIILTNQNAFGVQNILVPRGSDINYTQLSGGLNVIEYPAGMQKPEPLQMTSTPAEVFNMLSKLETTMETISGINSVTRGNPEASLRSGAALALVQAQALQFASGLQQSFVRMVENVGTGTIKLLQDFAIAPRVAAIVGKANRTYLKEFKGDDLSDINRVVVDITNPVSKSAAGRLQMATDLIQYNIVDNLEQYMTILTTGNLEVMTQGQQHEMLLVQSENERMAEGESVQVLSLDSHLMHIKEHKAVLYDPDLRKDPKLVQNVLNHIQEHIEMLKTTNPELLQLIGEQPLSPEQPQPPNQEAMDQSTIDQTVAPVPTGMEAYQEQALPQIPTVDSDLLANPQIQQDIVGNVE